MLIRKNIWKEPVKNLIDFQTIKTLKILEVISLFQIHLKV